MACRRTGSSWNAPDWSGFDIADLFAVDTAIARDMAQIFSFLAGGPMAVYPEDYQADGQEIIAAWRRPAAVREGV